MLFSISMTSSCIISSVKKSCPLARNNVNANLGLLQEAKAGYTRAIEETEQACEFKLLLHSLRRNYLFSTHF